MPHRVVDSYDVEPHGFQLADSFRRLPARRLHGTEAHVGATRRREEPSHVERGERHRRHRLLGCDVDRDEQRVDRDEQRGPRGRSILVHDVEREAGAEPHDAVGCARDRVRLTDAAVPCGKDVLEPHSRNLQVVPLQRLGRGRARVSRRAPAVQALLGRLAAAAGLDFLAKRPARAVEPYGRVVGREA